MVFGSIKAAKNRNNIGVRFIISRQIKAYSVSIALTCKLEINNDMFEC
jgi:hypothetical protein